jgi:general secretion pathway protein E
MIQSNMANLLRDARRLASVSGRLFLEELETLTGETPAVLIQAIAPALEMPVASLDDMFAMEAAFDLLPLAKAMQRHCVLFRSGPTVILVLSDPFDLGLQAWMEARAGTTLVYRLALQSDIRAYLGRKEELARAIDHLFTGAAAVSEEIERFTKRKVSALSFASASEAQSPAVRLVDSTLYDALKAGASDIHLETTEVGLVVRYRIDGVLDHVMSIDGIGAAEQVVSRLKVLASLDIAERRVPQDGSFRVEAAGRDIDLRLSIMPSIHGEDAVVRILDKRGMLESDGSLTLEALGFDGASLAELRRLSDEPYGMLLVTGPTGSGKTTTLYAALSEVHTGRDKVITIEDPVEYHLPGVLQIPVNEKKGLGFARGLRSILRHDPDKIMVGEIRDRETAEIAVQCALTGHLVLTTVHANNVFDVFGRFSHMGIDLYAFVSSLNGIWAQRLVRMNCPHCATGHTPSESDLARSGLTLEQTTGYVFRRGAGCGQCRGTGYKGRKAIAEILCLNDEIREYIIEKRPIRQIRQAARANGTRTLREMALELARNGLTSIEEVRRVTLRD